MRSGAAGGCRCATSRSRTGCGIGTNAVLGAVSYAGSHVLSLAYLVLYGRYVSDTLSAVRAVRAADALAIRRPI